MNPFFGGMGFAPPPLSRELPVFDVNLSLDENLTNLVLNLRDEKEDDFHEDCDMFEQVLQREISAAHQNNNNNTNNDTNGNEDQHNDNIDEQFIDFGQFTFLTTLLTRPCKQFTVDNPTSFLSLLYTIITRYPNQLHFWLTNNSERLKQFLFQIFHISKLQYQRDISGMEIFLFLANNGYFESDYLLSTFQSSTTIELQNQLQWDQIKIQFPSTEQFNQLQTTLSTITSTTNENNDTTTQNMTNMTCHESLQSISNIIDNNTYNDIFSLLGFTTELTIDLQQYFPRLIRHIFKLISFFHSEISPNRFLQLLTSITLYYSISTIQTPGRCHGSIGIDYELDHCLILTEMARLCINVPIPAMISIVYNHVLFPLIITQLLQNSSHISITLLLELIVLSPDNTLLIELCNHSMNYKTNYLLHYLHSQFQLQQDLLPNQLCTSNHYQSFLSLPNIGRYHTKFLSLFINCTFNSISNYAKLHPTQTTSFPIELNPFITLFTTLTTIPPSHPIIDLNSINQPKPDNLQDLFQFLKKTILPHRSLTWYQTRHQLITTFLLPLYYLRIPDILMIQKFHFILTCQYYQNSFFLQPNLFLQLINNNVNICQPPNEIFEHHLEEKYLSLIGSSIQPWQTFLIENHFYYLFFSWCIYFSQPQKVVTNDGDNNNNNDEQKLQTIATSDIFKSMVIELEFDPIIAQLPPKPNDDQDYDDYLEKNELRQIKRATLLHEKYFSSIVQENDQNHIVDEVITTQTIINPFLLDLSSTPLTHTQLNVWARSILYNYRNSIPSLQTQWIDTTKQLTTQFTIFFDIKMKDYERRRGFMTMLGDFIDTTGSREKTVIEDSIVTLPIILQFQNEFITYLNQYGDE